MKYSAIVNKQKFEITIDTVNGTPSVTVDGHSVHVDFQRVGGTTRYSLLLSSASHDLIVYGNGGTYQVHYNGKVYPVSVQDHRDRSGSGALHKAPPSGMAEVRAPMPGMVSEIEVQAGDKVTKGRGLAIIEAMKMENELRSPVDGTVTEIKIKRGDTVEKDAVLVVIDTTCP